MRIKGLDSTVIATFGHSLRPVGLLVAAFTNQLRGKENRSVTYYGGVP